MQAHACDLRVEVERDWDTLCEIPRPAGPELDQFVHDAVDDWRRCPLRADVRLLVGFAEKVTRAAAACTIDDADALRDAGWSDVAIHDATQVIAYFNYINRIADALGVDPEAGLPRWGRREPTPD